MYRYYMRKADMEEPPKLEEPLDERDGRYKRLKNKQSEEHDANEKMLEEKFYRYLILVYKQTIIRLGHTFFFENFSYWPE